jgi:L-rhamnose-H+ transport protein
MLSWLTLAAAGILNGTFAVPMKTAKRWGFDHIWAAFSILAMIVLPWLAIWIAIPRWTFLVSSVPVVGLIRLIALGLLWGAASLLYGLAVDALGVSLGISIQLGLSIVVGALVPRLWLSATAAPAGSPVAFYVGLATMVAGVIVCAGAGRGKSASANTRDTSRFRRGLMIAIAGGLGAPLLNIGIQYGLTLLSSYGSERGSGQVVAWVIFLSAASLTQSGFCFARIMMRGTQREYFRGPVGSEWLRVGVMAVVWAASIFLYAFSAAALGPLGTSVGWPIFIGLIVVTSNAWGVALGEWEQKQGSHFRQMLAGSSLLILATFLVAKGR